MKQTEKIIGSIRSVQTKLNMNINISLVQNFASKSSWFAWGVVPNPVDLHEKSFQWLFQNKDCILEQSLALLPTELHSKSVVTNPIHFPISHLMCEYLTKRTDYPSNSHKSWEKRTILTVYKSVWKTSDDFQRYRISSAMLQTPQCMWYLVLWDRFKWKPSPFLQAFPPPPMTTNYHGAILAQLSYSIFMRWRNPSSQIPKFQISNHMIVFID